MAEITREEMRDRLGNIDQIRNLLFGNELEDSKQRFAASEQRLQSLESELSEFKAEIRDRLTQLENSLSTEIRTVADSLEKSLNTLA